VIDIIEHDGVTQWRFSTLAGRLSNYTASAFLTSDGVLIDTGIPASSRAFARLLDRTVIRGAMLTHHHEDHAGNVELLAARGVPLWIAPATLPLVTTVAPIATYRRAIWTSMPPLRSAVTPFEPAGLEPIATPGHSPDHHVIWDAATRTLFSGDLFLGVAVRIAHHDEDPWQTMLSLERAAALEPVRMFDAHRGLVIHPSSALRAKAAWTRALIATITARLERGESDRQIIAAELGGESLPGYFSGGEYSRRNFVRAVRRRIEQVVR
jgi:glyoxylase-like metal-dependent hydrolase (beta-lactamase superfamily II)